LNIQVYCDQSRNTPPATQALYSPRLLSPWMSNCSRPVALVWLVQGTYLWDFYPERKAGFTSLASQIFYQIAIQGKESGQ